VLDTVRDTSKVAWILLGKAAIDTVEGNVLTMAFDSEGNARGFSSSGSDGYLANVLERMFGIRPVIRAIVNPAASAGPGRGAARMPDGNSGGASSRPAPSQGAVPSADQDTPDLDASRSAATSTRGEQGTGRDAAARNPAGSRSGRGSGGGQSDGEQSDRGQSSGGPSPRRPSASGQSGDDQAGGDRPAAQPADARSPRPARRGAKAASTPTRQNQSSGSAVSDDPRPHTDAASGGDDLTGTDLIMRELGGTMIEGT